MIGGLGSLVGAVWGAALLVFLPNWTNDIANSFSLSTNVSHNLPIAVYGLVLIGAMLVWPSGIQGGVRAIVAAARPVGGEAGRGARPPAPSTGAGAAGRRRGAGPRPGRAAKASSER